MYPRTQQERIRIIERYYPSLAENSEDDTDITDNYEEADEDDNDD